MRVVITNGGQEKTSNISKQSITLKWREKSWYNLLTGHWQNCYPLLPTLQNYILQCWNFKVLPLNLAASSKVETTPKAGNFAAEQGKKASITIKDKISCKGGGGGSDEGMLITESKAPKLETESSTCWKKCFLYATHCKTLRHLGSSHMLHNSTADWNNCSSFANSVKLHGLEYC